MDIASMLRSGYGDDTAIPRCEGTCAAFVSNAQEGLTIRVSRCVREG
jgi:hypothetical protein